MTALTASPQPDALIRGWVGASTNTALLQAQPEMEQAVQPWLRQTLAAGQRVGAVRNDLPPGLLICVVAGMGQAMDTWMVTQQPGHDDLTRLIGALLNMIRGAVKP